MGYLEQFARNRRKEKSEVLTARLPQSLYHDFKAYCDELGLSISEAVCLLVEHEMKRNESKNTTINYKNDEVATTREYISNDDVIEANTNVVVKEIEKNTKKSKATTARGVLNRWKVDDQLPCPICDKWVSASNFKRHIERLHDPAIASDDFLNIEEYQDKINAMIEEKKG